MCSIQPLLTEAVRIRNSLSYPQEGEETDGHPVGQELLHHRLRPASQKATVSGQEVDGRTQPRPTGRRLSPPQHQLRVLGHILFHQVVEQRLEDVGEVLQFAMQGHCEQRGHVGPVPGGEGALNLQGVDELGRWTTKTVLGIIALKGLCPRPEQRPTLVRKSLLLSRLDS